MAGTAVRAGDLLVSSTVSEEWVLPRSPVAGTVVGVREVRRTDGSVSAAVVVQPGPYQHDVAPRLTPRPFSEQLMGILTAPSDVRGRWVGEMMRAGLGVDRPSTPDLGRQLRLASRDPSAIDTVLVTAMDPDPHLAVAARLVDEATPDLIAGAMLLVRVTGAGRLVFVLERCVPERARRDVGRLAAEGSRLAVSVGLRAATRVVVMSNTYPSAFPALLSRRVLRRGVTGRGTAEELVGGGMVVLDAAAAVSIGRYARYDQPVTHVSLGLFDHRGGGPHLLRVPVGMSLGEVLRLLGLGAGGTEIRRGDVLQELRVPGDAIVSPSDLYLHVLPAEGLGKPSDPCIRCGWCIEVCPTGVNPAGVLESVQLARSAGGPARGGAEACVECGLCQYVCPSRLPLLGALREAMPEAKVLS